MSNADAAVLPAVPRAAQLEPVPAVAGAQPPPMAVVRVLLPLRIVSEANAREHWRVKAKRAAAHRRTALALCSQASASMRPPQGARVRIELTRIAGRLLDDDNLAGGFKAVRDGVADWLGMNDGSALLRWVYGQRLGRPRQYAAEVVVSWEVPG